MFLRLLEWTRGPWSPTHQHAGPPSALVAGRLEEMAGDGFRVVRVAVEIPRPVPIGKLRLERSVRRDGRSVRAFVGKLFNEEGKLVMSAEALALAAVELDIDAPRPPMDELSPEESSNSEFPFQDTEPGYAKGMEVRFARGTFGTGDVMAWMRMRHTALRCTRADRPRDPDVAHPKARIASPRFENARR
jgi:hypothetical protein